jgi:CRP/FNR family transcriptional regulator, cyclic AMP receptor protein
VTPGDEPSPHDFLGALPQPARRALEAVARRRTYAAGDTLVHEHDDTGGVLVLLEGQVVASTSAGEGQEVAVTIAGPGELVGELAALTRRPRTATLRARTDVVALAISADDFRALLRTDPDAASAVLDVVIARLDAADDQRRELVGLDVAGRVARRLLDLAERFGTPCDDGGVEVAVTQDELAAWTGASREAVTKALQALRALHAVETHRRRVVVVDAQALRRRGGLART